MQGSLWHILTQHPTINIRLCQTSARVLAARVKNMNYSNSWGLRGSVCTEECSPAEPPECCFSSDWSSSAVWCIKIQHSSPETSTVPHIIYMPCPFIFMWLLLMRSITNNCGKKQNHCIGLGMCEQSSQSMLFFFLKTVNNNLHASLYTEIVPDL